MTLFPYLGHFSENFSIKLPPSLIYLTIEEALKLLVDCLEFTIGRHELNVNRPFCVVEKMV